MRGSLNEKKEVEDLNLIPLMNLFVTMIPLLLLTAAFYHIGMVNVSVPTQSEGESSIETGPTSVSVQVRMTNKGYFLTASSTTVSEKELKSLDAFVPKERGEFDYQTLTLALAKIKERYEESDTLMLLPAAKTSYDEMIQTMDAARTMSFRQPQSKKLASTNTTQRLDGQRKRRRLRLFPKVVVTTTL